MKNPFDRDFLKFFVGFIAILSVSFGILALVGLYSESTSASVDQQ